MSIEFGNYLKELRTAKKIGLDDLAERMFVDQSEVKSWEDGSVLPTRVNVYNIGRVAHFDKSEIDRLLELSNYVKLESFEIVALFPTKWTPFLTSFPTIVEWRNSLANTGSTMGGTISTMGEKVDSIEARLKSINFGDYLTDIERDTFSVKEIEAKFEAKIEYVTKDVEAIKELIPKLEDVNTQLAKSNEFVDNHVDFFRSVVDGEGIIKTINIQMESFEKRLDRVENQVYRSLDRTITIIALIVSTLLALYAIFKP